MWRRGGKRLQAAGDTARTCAGRALSLGTTFPHLPLPAIVHTTEQLNAALAGRYVIERLVGEGGMATVYLARDLKHDRLVALKVLKPELGAVLGVERFLAEIKVTANLQHPNLLPLFDSGAADGLLFYVMPFVEGESLRARLDREKQLPIEEAVRLALAVASALDYAHRHGVIHRDLKPENILLHDGQPVIADFGIALAVSNAGGARVTQTGLSLGTPQYMSPEQASGDRAIDARSDIYSLAAVTYEMIAGEAPHTGTTAQAIMAKLMTAEPAPLSTLRKSAPVHVEAAVERALSKLPADRFTSAREFADALEGRGFTLASGGRMPRASAAPARSIVRDRLVIGLAAVTVGALAVASYALRASKAEVVPGATVRFPIVMPAANFGGSVAAWTQLAVSADGRTIAFIGYAENGTTRVYIRGVDELEPRPIAGTEGAQSPVFSPDGQWIAYWANGSLYKMAVGGGTAVPITALQAPSGISWGRGGLIAASINNTLVTIPATGGEPRLLATPDSTAGEVYFTSPLFLSDGETVLFAGQGAGGFARVRIVAVSVKTKKVTRLDLLGLSPLGVVDGTLVYMTASNALNGVAFDSRALKTVGDPSPLGANAIVRPNGAADAAVSSTGTLVFLSSATTAQVGLVDLNGKFTPILDEPRPYFYPRYSPDGKRIALTIGTGARSDVWVHDIASKTNTRMTSEGTINERVEWAPDGTRVLYRSDRGKRSAIWWQVTDLSSPATPLLANDAEDYFEGVLSSDGKILAYQFDNSGSNQADLYYRAVSGDTTRKAVSLTASVENQPRISPDGKWISFLTDASGAPQVVVQPFPGPGGQVQVSPAGGSEAVWGKDGKHLYYRDGRQFVAVAYTTSPTFAVTSRTNLFVDEFVFAQSPHADYDVAPDGQHFLVVKSAEASKMVVAYNWGAEMKARLAGRK